MALWLDPSDTGNMFTSAGCVSNASLVDGSSNLIDCWNDSRNGIQFTTNNSSNDNYKFKAADPRFNNHASLKFDFKLSPGSSNMAANVSSLTGDHSYHYFLLMYLNRSTETETGSEFSDSLITFEDSASNPTEKLEFNSKAANKDLEFDGAAVTTLSYDQAVIVSVSYDSVNSTLVIAVDGSVVSSTSHGPIDLNGNIRLGHDYNTLSEMVVGDFIVYDRALPPTEANLVIDQMKASKGM